jgi:hypothetical protein
VWRDKVEKRWSHSCYVTLKVTNQSHESKTFDETGYEHINESFDFVINSKHQFHGRPLVVELWEKHTLSNKPIGMGMIDLNEIAEKHEHMVKVYLNHKT